MDTVGAANPKQDTMPKMAEPEIKGTEELGAARESVEGLRDLAQARDSLRDILDRAGDALVVIDPETGGYVYVNQRACTSLQYTRDEMLSLNNAAVAVTAEPKDFLTIAAELGPEETITRTGAMRRKDGSHLPVEARVSIVEFLGKPRVLVVARDISDRLEAEKALQQSEQLYRELFEQYPIPTIEGDWSDLKRELDGLQSAAGDIDIEDWLTDIDLLRRLHKLIRRSGMNDALMTLYGVSSQDALVQHVKSRSERDEVLETFRALLVALYRGAMTYEAVRHETDRAGRDMIVQLRYFLPPGSGENWSRVFTTLEDVTEKTATEQALRQSQKMEAIGKLTGGVAHDFNNLLAVIQGCAECLEPPSRQDEDLVKEILRAVDKGASLTHRLLAYARKQPLAPEAINLGSLVVGMKGMLTRALGATIDVDYSAQDALWNCRADPGQVEDALLNLAINARDAMPDGGKLIIECANATLDDRYTAEHPEAAPGDYAMLAVTDTGTGMTEEVMAKAFEPFYSTKGVGEGSGLGLSMVYGFTNQSGGHLAISSQEGKGTTVTIYLPREKAESQSAASGANALVSKGNGQSVLIIEDDPHVRELVARMTSSLTYRAVAVSDVAAARELLEREEQFDLILSDVVLPGGVSGPEFADEIRAQNPDAAIIFMSGYPAEAATQLTSSNNVLLNKPFRRDVLAKALRDAIEKASKQDRCAEER